MKLLETHYQVINFLHYQQSLRMESRHSPMNPCMIKPERIFLNKVSEIKGDTLFHYVVDFPN